MSVLTQFFGTGRRVVRITSSTTWVVPAGVGFIDVILVGGGGGAGWINGGWGGGGRGGCVAYYKWVSVTPGISLSITVGAGGAGGTWAGAAGATGGTTQITASSIGLSLSAPGGAGGYSPSSNVDGSLDPNPHQAGDPLPVFGTYPGYRNQYFGNNQGSHGGSCLAQGPTTAGASGAPNTGCGGAGAFNAAGGSGGSGVVYIFY